MPSRRAILSTTITAASLAALAAVAINSSAPSQAGKTMAAAPIVKTHVKTTKRTVHVKNKRTIEVVRSNPSAAPARVAVAASGSGAAAPTSQPTQQRSAGQANPSYEAEGREHEAESESHDSWEDHEREDAAEYEGEEGDD